MKEHTIIMNKQDIIRSILSSRSGDAWTGFSNNKNKKLLGFVVDRCIKENFPIDEYFLFEIPFYNDEYVIMYFENIKDFKQYHELGNHSINIKEIAFEVHFNGQAIPLKWIGKFDDGSGLHIVEQVDADNCFEAALSYEILGDVELF